MPAPTREEQSLNSRLTRAAPTRAQVAVCLLLLALVGPLVQDVTAQSGSRFALTAALAEQGTVAIDDYRAVTAPIDRIEIDGHIYSDKAPLQPLLSVPPYALARVFGAESASAGRVEGNLTLWWVALWAGVVPTMALLVLAHRQAWAIDPAHATAAVVSLLLGTMLPLFATNVFGHALAGCLGFAAWTLVAGDETPSAARCATAGLLAGLAISAEYPLAVVAAVVFGYLTIAHRWRAVWFAVGAVPGAAVLAWYQGVAFGDPFSVSYEAKDLAGGSDVGFAVQPLSTWVNATVGTRGVLLLTPLVALGMAAAWLQARSPGPARRHGAVALAIGVGLLAMIVTRPSTWPNPIGGEVPITRHFYPLMPFLAVPLTWAWRRWRVACLAATALGALVMAAAALTVVYIPGNASVVSWYRIQLSERGLIDSVLTLGVGPAGWLLHIAAVAAAGWLLVRWWPEVDDDRPGTRAGPAEVQTTT